MKPDVLKGYKYKPRVFIDVEINNVPVSPVVPVLTPAADSERLVRMVSQQWYTNDRSSAFGGGYIVWSYHDPLRLGPRALHCREFSRTVYKCFKGGRTDLPRNCLPPNVEGTLDTRWRL